MTLHNETAGAPRGGFGIPSAPHLECEKKRALVLPVLAAGPVFLVAVLSGGFAGFSVFTVVGMSFGIGVAVILAVMTQHRPSQLSEKQWRELSLQTSFCFWYWAVLCGHFVAEGTGTLGPLLLAVFFAPYVTTAYIARRSLVERKPHERKRAADFSVAADATSEPPPYDFPMFLWGTFR